MVSLVNLREQFGITWEAAVSLPQIDSKTPKFSLWPRRGGVRFVPVSDPSTQVLAVSEEDRSRLYAWFREQTDEPLAEYLMSCLAPAPLSDLATKADIGNLRTDIGATKADIGNLESRFDQLFLLRESDRAEATSLRESDRAEATALREADRKELAAQREADRKELVTQREADRKEFQRGLRRIAIALPAEIVVALAAVIAISEWLRS